MKIKEGLFTSPTLYRAMWVYRIAPLLATGATMAFIWIVMLFEMASASSAESSERSSPK